MINTRDKIGDKQCAYKIINRTIDEFNEDNIKNIAEYMFYRCLVLASVDLPAVTNIGAYSFAYCSALTKISLPNVVNVEQYAFNECRALNNIYFPKAKTINTQAFRSCSGLTYVCLPEVITIYNYIFQDCSALITVDLSSITSIGSGVFRSCNALTSIIIRNDTQVCTYSNTSTAYDPSNANLKIYVPRALLDQYKTATNWVRLADKFVALEDYDFEYYHTVRFLILGANNTVELCEINNIITDSETLTFDDLCNMYSGDENGPTKSGTTIGLRYDENYSHIYGVKNSTTLYSSMRNGVRTPTLSVTYKGNSSSAKLYLGSNGNTEIEDFEDYVVDIIPTLKEA